MPSKGQLKCDLEDARELNRAYEADKSKHAEQLAQLARRIVEKDEKIVARDVAMIEAGYIPISMVSPRWVLNANSGHIPVLSLEIPMWEPVRSDALIAKLRKAGNA